MNKLLLLVAVLLLSGCAVTHKDIRVLQSKSTINIKHIEIQDQDTLICDPEGCKVLR